MTRRKLLLIGAGVALGAALLFLLMPTRIDQPQATAIAERLHVQYRRQSGEPLARFGPREARHWADGWEFRWRYRPCADQASLRIWVSSDGRRAHYAELPDCLPQRGFGAGIQTVAARLPGSA
ncbi:hypothetical protein [Polymorphobacter sp.]|uniref:hypothetical protein n=1 Tax=Polymorphobacter sp. TaxID=1909290 RepID=UPI003F71D736